ncbi:MAG: hypothetical protein KDK36_00830, partial [Leptospiraceae bacterium]|nr:hypothetical protein [Leptospiraceae bacterium]
MVLIILSLDDNVFSYVFLFLSIYYIFFKEKNSEKEFWIYSIIGLLSSVIMFYINISSLPWFIFLGVHLMILIYYEDYLCNKWRTLFFGVSIFLFLLLFSFYLLSLTFGLPLNEFFNESIGFGIKHSEEANNSPALLFYSKKDIFKLTLSSGLFGAYRWNITPGEIGNLEVLFSLKKFGNISFNIVIFYLFSLLILIVMNLKNISRKILFMQINYFIFCVIGFLLAYNYMDTAS